MSHTASTDRLDVWRDLIREHFVALDIAAERRDGFAGQVRSADLGHLNLATVRSVTQDFTRTSRLAVADDDVYLQVGLLTRGAGLLQQDGREAALTPGDFAVYETDRPFRWSLRYDWELLVFTWPRATVMLTDTETQALTARSLSGSEGLGAIVSTLLRTLVTAPPQLSVDGGIRLGGEVADLVSTVAGEQVRAGAPERSARSLLHRIDRYILDRLSDPRLGPSEIADAHFISTRHLHRLFAERGSTVTQQIQRLRLERSRVDLRHPGYADRSITEIAQRWGFSDLAAFSRAFRATYGVTPSESRNTPTASTRVPSAAGSAIFGDQLPTPAKKRKPTATRGLTGRPHRTRDQRLPPGQHDTGSDWPVLTTEAMPQLNPEQWTITIDGLVDKPRTWTWQDLHLLPQSTYNGDIHCVTTWSKLGTRFGGVSLDLLLAEVAPQPQAAFVFATSATGYTTNLPLARVTGAQAWIVWTHEGRPLSREHGGPVRLLVPHLYFWKSAKWVTRLTLLEHDRQGSRERDGYHDVGDPWREQRYQGD